MKKILLDAYMKGIPVQEMLSLWAGLRPLARIGVSAGQMHTLKNLCRKLSLNTVTINSYGPCPQNPLILISRSRSKLKDFEKTEKKIGNERNINAGKELGYPDCCVKKYAKNMHQKIRNIPVHTLYCTNDTPDFRLNYLYNWESRVFDYNEFRRSMEGYHKSNCYIIHHIPCSFTCKKSIAYASSMCRILKSYFLPLYETIETFLNKPVLFLNDFVFFPLCGKIINGVLRYHGFIRIHNNLPPAITELLKKGNMIKNNGNRLFVYNNSVRLEALPMRARLINFR